jgi:hypothetical protein
VSDFRSAEDYAALAEYELELAAQVTQQKTTNYYLARAQVWAALAQARATAESAG